MVRFRHGDSMEFRGLGARGRVRDGWRSLFVLSDIHVVDRGGAGGAAEVLIVSAAANIDADLVRRRARPATGARQSE
jgi:hypothetical protein